MNNTTNNYTCYRIFKEHRPVLGSIEWHIGTYIYMKQKLLRLLKVFLPEEREIRPLSRKRAWDVYTGHKKIDTVWFDKEQTAWHVRRSLVYHDGYPGNIEVVLNKSIV